MWLQCPHSRTFPDKNILYWETPRFCVFCQKWTGKAAAEEELSKPVQPPSTKAGRDEISRSGEPLTPIYVSGLFSQNPNENT